MDRLVELPGVGRKTANVVMGTAFRQATGVVVDTHVTRISRRLGMTREKTAEKIERDLMAVLPQERVDRFLASRDSSRSAGLPGQKAAV